MTRLLFAAARGARVQAFDRNFLDWILSSHAPLALSNDKRPYRIHPDDAHLAYGPISTALRTMAERSFEPWTLSGLLARTAFEYELEHPYIGPDESHLTNFILILAEALADEGL
jgi:hypothetical protein